MEWGIINPDNVGKMYYNGNTDSEMFSEEYDGSFQYSGSVNGSGDNFDPPITKTPTTDEPTTTIFVATTTINAVTSTDTKPEIQLRLTIPALVTSSVGLIGFVALLVLLSRWRKNLHFTFAKCFLCHVCFAQALVVMSLPLIAMEELYSNEGYVTVSKTKKLRQFVYYLSFFTSIFFLLYISVGQFFSINKMIRKRLNTPLLLNVSSVVIWIVSCVACVPVFLVPESDFANTIMLSVISIFYITCFVFTSIFIVLKYLYDLNRRKMHGIKVAMPTKIEVKTQSTDSEINRRLRNSCVFITISFFLSWILFVLVTTSNHEEKIVLLATKENTVLVCTATFFPYAFAAIVPYILILYFGKFAVSNKKISNHERV